MKKSAELLLRIFCMLILATNALSEWRRCRGGEFEPEGSVLKYVTEGENEAGAADLLTTRNLLTHATMLCQNEGAVKWPS